jgi:hypothetical protein
MDELEQQRLMVIAEMARAIFVKMATDVNASYEERIKMAEVAHNYAVDFLDVHEKWLKSRYPIITKPDYNLNGYNSDILLGGDFYA